MINIRFIFRKLDNNFHFHITNSQFTFQFISIEWTINLSPIHTPIRSFRGGYNYAKHQLVRIDSVDVEVAFAFASHLALQVAFEGGRGSEGARSTQRHDAHRRYSDAHGPRGPRPGERRRQQRTHSRQRREA